MNEIYELFMKTIGNSTKDLIISNGEKFISVRPTNPFA
jgi:hypothetical protein